MDDNGAECADGDGSQYREDRQISSCARRAVELGEECDERRLLGDSLALAPVIVRAYQLGAMFDSWTEYFSWDVWTQAFKDCGVDMQEYVGEIPEDKVLPWDFIDIGVSKKYLLGQKHLAYQAVTTKNCREGCNGCGANKLGRCTII